MPTLQEHGHAAQGDHGEGGGQKLGAGGDLHHGAVPRGEARAYERLGDGVHALAQLTPSQHAAIRLAQGHGVGVTVQVLQHEASEVVHRSIPKANR